MAQKKDWQTESDPRTKQQMAKIVSDLLKRF